MKNRLNTEFVEMCKQGRWENHLATHLTAKDYEVGLSWAVSEGHLDVVKTMLCHPHTPNGFNPRFGNGELAFLALKHDRKDVLVFLLEGDYPQKININIRTGDLLVRAAMGQQLDMVRFLMGDERLTQHIRPDTSNGVALRNACMFGHVDVVEVLTSSPEALWHEPCWIQRQDEILTHALQQSKMDLLDYLTGSKMPDEQRFDLHSKDPDLLMQNAVYSIHAIDYLLQKGVAPTHSGAFIRSLGVANNKVSERLFKLLPPHFYSEPHVNFSHMLYQVLSKEVPFADTMIRNIWKERPELIKHEMVLLKKENPASLNHALPVLYDLDPEFTSTLLNSKVKKTPNGQILSEKIELERRLQASSMKPNSRKM